MSYRLNGDVTADIRFVDPPVRLGTGDFTMTATLTPSNTSRRGRRTHADAAVLLPTYEFVPFGLQIGATTTTTTNTVAEVVGVTATLYSRLNLAADTGFVIILRADPATATVILARNASIERILNSSVTTGLGGPIPPTPFPTPSPSPDGATTTPTTTTPSPEEFGSLQFVTVSTENIFQAGIPARIRVVRQGLTISAFVNNVRRPIIAQQRAASQPVDVDGGLNEPLSVLPGLPIGVSSIADMSILTSAILP